MLENNNIVGNEKTLFGLDIDVELCVFLVQVVERDIFYVTNRIRQRSIYPRPLHRRVGKED